MTETGRTNSEGSIEFSCIGVPQVEQNKEVRSNMERVYLTDGVFACRWRSGSAVVAAPAAAGAALRVHSAVTDPGPESCHPSHHA